tara:strand:+ start:310 stop:729 length:420 start_codon:yes stop_codon:yes gene_type:complete
VIIKTFFLKLSISFISFFKKKNWLSVSIVSPDFDVITNAVFCRLIAFINFKIDHSSTFSKKNTFGEESLKKKFSFIETRVLPPRLEPPVPKNKTFSKFLSCSAKLIISFKLSLYISSIKPNDFDKISLIIFFFCREVIF